jgi:hypothetical protein
VGEPATKLSGSLALFCGTFLGQLRFVGIHRIRDHLIQLALNAVRRETRVGFGE